MDDAEACERKMFNASALIEGLGGEKVFDDVIVALLMTSLLVDSMDCGWKDVPGTN